MTSVAANVIVEGPCSSPARVSRWMSASAASGLSAPLVIATMVGRSGRAASASATRTVSALRPDWLTHTTSVPAATAGSRKWRSSAASSIVAAIPAAPSAVTIG